MATTPKPTKIRIRLDTLVGQDPNTAAMISKATPDSRRRPNRDHLGNRKPQLSDVSMLRSAVESRARKNLSAKMALELLPDLAMGKQILVGSILSPADMTGSKFTLGSKSDVFTSGLRASLIDRIKDYYSVDSDYKIERELPTILADALVEKGADVLAIVPENALDELINGQRSVSTESLTHHFTNQGFVRAAGVLGSPTVAKSETVRGFSMETYLAPKRPDEIARELHLIKEDGASLGTVENIIVTDNFMALKVPKLSERMRKQSKERTIRTNLSHAGLESFHQKLSDLEVERAIFAGKTHKHELTADFKPQADLKRRSIGRPLWIKIPSEAIINAYVPGDYTRRVGSFILLDAEGHVIKADINDYAGYYNGQANTTQGGQSNQLNILQRIHNSIGGGVPANPNHRFQLETISQIWGDMVVRDWVNRIKNGTHGASVELSQNNDFYRVMLARSLEGKVTQVLYIPEEYLSYIAFDYDENGIGKSILDNLSTVNMLRSVVMFNNVLSSVRNSIPRTRVGMQVPADDPNPQQIVEDSMDEIMRTRAITLPPTIARPQEAMDLIQRMGYEWEITGNTALPDIKFTFENAATQLTKPDSDLDQQLQKLGAYGFGVNPEQIDKGFSGDFATSVAAGSVMFGKRIIQHQDTFCPQIADRLKKLVRYDQILVDELKELILGNVDQIALKLDGEVIPNYDRLDDDSKQQLTINRALNLFIEALEVTLPRPPSVTLENQSQMLQTYGALLDAGIDAFISDQILTAENAGQVSGQVATIRANLKAYMMRDFMAKKGILTELSDITSTQEDGKPLVNLMDAISQHIEAVIRSCVKSAASLDPIKKAADSDLSKLSDSSGGASDGGGMDLGDGTDDLGAEPMGGDDTGDDPTAEEDPTNDSAGDKPAAAAGAGGTPAADDAGLDFEDEPKPDK